MINGIAAMTQAFVITGCMKSGKSSTGNSIIGTKVFKTAPGTEPCTTKVKVEIHQKELISIVDTPPLKDASDLKAIDDYLKKTYNFGNLIYGIVIAIGRFSKDERMIIEDLFKKKVFKRKPIIIFTRRNEFDELEDISKQLQEWIHRCPSLETIIQTFDLEYLSIENSKVEEKRKYGEDILLAAKSAGLMKLDVKLPDGIPLRQTTYDVTTFDFQNTDTPECSQNYPVNTPEIKVDFKMLQQHFGKSGETFYLEMYKKQYNQEFNTPLLTGQKFVYD